MWLLYSQRVYFEGWGIRYHLILWYMALGFQVDVLVEMYVCGLGSGLVCYLFIGFRVLDMDLIVRLHAINLGLNVSLFLGCRCDNVNYYLEANILILKLFWKCQNILDPQEYLNKVIQVINYFGWQVVHCSIYDHQKWIGRQKESNKDIHIWSLMVNHTKSHCDIWPH